MPDSTQHNLLASDCQVALDGSEITMTTASEHCDACARSRPPYRQAANRRLDCPECDGKGEIGTRQDYFGNWDTEQCRCCQGEAEVTPERATEWRQRLEDYT